MKRSFCKLLVALIFLGGSSPAKGQILFTESFAVILDTTQRIKGSVVPDLKFQTQRKDLLEFENNVNISFRFQRSAITLANKVEVSRFGGENFLSGGYVYGEYRRILPHHITIEPFMQVQWADARGMERKYALGANIRWRIFNTQKTGLFAGTGPFYEYERWNYDGVRDEVLRPGNQQPITMESIKSGSYISWKYQATDNVFVDFSLYHQSQYDKLLTKPRLASSSNVTYNFTEHLGLTLLYQNIYDYEPVVPIEKSFQRIILSVSISF